jgi:hypothetical protein
VGDDNTHIPKCLQIVSLISSKQFLNQFNLYLTSIVGMHKIIHMYQTLTNQAQEQIKRKSGKIR